MISTIYTLLAESTSNGILEGFLQQQGQNVLNGVLQWFAGLPWWVWVIVAVVILSIFVKPVASVLAWLVKAAIFLISAPFKFFGWLFGGDKK